MRKSVGNTGPYFFHQLDSQEETILKVPLYFLLRSLIQQSVREDSLDMISQAPVSVRAHSLRERLKAGI